MLMLVIEATTKSTVIGHSLGGAVSLALDKQYKKEGNNPYGIV